MNYRDKRARDFFTGRLNLRRDRIELQEFLSVEGFPRMKLIRMHSKLRGDEENSGHRRAIKNLRNP
jgi:hypothetical protein